jgi:hypothetical protein
VIECGTGDRRFIAVTEPVLADIDLTVKFQPVSDGGADIFAEIGYRVGANLTSGGPDLGYMVSMVVDRAAGNGHIYLMTIDDFDVLATQHDVHLDDMAARYFRLLVKGTRHRLKWWLATDPEPPIWKFDIVDTEFASGRVFLGVSNDDVDHPEVGATVAWDDFSLLEVLPPPEGIRVLGQTAPIEAAYVGAELVVAAYQGTEPITL